MPFRIGTGLAPDPTCPPGMPDAAPAEWPTDGEAPVDGATAVEETPAVP